MQTITLSRIPNIVKIVLEAHDNTRAAEKARTEAYPGFVSACKNVGIDPANYKSIPAPVMQKLAADLASIKPQRSEKSTVGGCKNGSWITH